MTTNNKQQQEMIDLFFQTKPCLVSHVVALNKSPSTYKGVVQFICKTGIMTVVSSGVRARIIAALHICSQHGLVNVFLPHCEAIDIVKALNLLDRGRKTRQLEQRIEAIEQSHPHLIKGLDEEEEAPTTTEEESKEQESGTTKPKKKKKRKRKIDWYRMLKRNLETEEACPGSEGMICHEAHKDTAAAELIAGASVSGALSRKVRKWAKQVLKPDFLEYVLLALPHGAWRQLADLVHFSPADFSVPYFLHYLHREGGDDDNDDNNKKKKKSKKNKNNKKESDVMPTTQENNFVCRWKLFLENLEKGNAGGEVDGQFFALANEFPQVFLCYSLVRRTSKLQQNKTIMEEICAKAPLETVIWHYEEFHAASTRECSAILQRRLQGHEWRQGDEQYVGESSRLNYAKLIERILTFRRMGLKFTNDLVSMASARLELLQSSWQQTDNNNQGGEENGGKPRVAVFGDASYSMQRAIEAATIFASMVSICLDGELSFFSTDLIKSPYEKPCSVDQVLEVCNKVKACASTSLAAALWPYYKNKIVMDLIVLVTDEEENTPCHNYMFAPLLAEYKRTVNENVKLIVVCVGSGCSSFRASLDRNEIERKTVMLDGARPDLAKFDALLSQLLLFSPSSLSITTEEEAEGEEDFVNVQNDGGNESQQAQGDDEDYFMIVDS